MLDRTKYLDATEIAILRKWASLRAEHDRAFGMVHGPRVWLMVDLCLGTGLRINEVCRISVEDIDLGRGFIRVTRSKKRTKPKPESLAISPDLVDHLTEYLRTVGPKSGLLLVGKRGPLGIRACQHIWRQALKAAGLNHLGIHGARHSVAVHMLRATGNLRMVQKQLGHESPTTTANLYADVSFVDMQSALSKMYG